MNGNNTVNLVGRAGIAPIIRTFENGMKLAKFSLATNETISEVNGKKKLTQWHQIIAWGTHAEQIEKHVKKGQLLAIDGKITYRSWKDASGKTNRMTEIQVNEVFVINPKQKAG
jgi:single-strand DNA-binding protein